MDARIPLLDLDTHDEVIMRTLADLIDAFLSDSHLRACVPTLLRGNERYLLNPRQ